MNLAAQGLPESATTGWIGAESDPVRPGVYGRRAPAGPFACWDGQRWRADAKTPAAAARSAGASRFTRSPWRGMLAPSEAPCATCRGNSVLDRGVDVDTGVDLIEECPDC